MAFVGIVVKVNGRETFRQVIDIADADEPVIEVIAPLFLREGVVDERLDVIGGIFGSVVWPAACIRLEFVEFVV